ncbi:MAG: S8 family peptidase [Phycisphaerales bacterium]|nr:S8 family peptidase [Phycisphaerales bacterium]
MAESDNQHKRHFILEGTAETERFRYPPGGGRGSAVPERNRNQHGNTLLRQIKALYPQLRVARDAQEATGLEEGFGLQVEFESFPDIELAVQSLDRTGSGIELRNVRHEGERTLATVFVPDGKLDVFENLIRDYLDEAKDSKNGPKNRMLLNTISEIRAATLNALWTDDPAVLPTSDEEMFWWEVWLPVRGDREATTGRFKQLAEGRDFQIADGELQFPERTVLLAYGSAGQMKQSILTLNSIAELRRAKETAEFFDALFPNEQPAWVNELLGRITVPEEEAEVPHVCIFDTGVNHGHPLIATVLSSADLHTVEPGWGTDDSDGHGTAMAGLAMAGNLTEALVSNDPVQIGYRLESVKLLPGDGANSGDARHHGYLTTEAVARPEITAPQRHRLFSMAVTTRDNRDRGRPSAWSAAIDRLAADADGYGETPRLFVISAGNVSDPNAWAESPNSNGTDGIHDPGQSWNALTVGAATHLVQITEPGTDHYQPIAPAGGLSPFSTTSLTWQSQWPLKPDVVFEGGNAAKNALGAVWMPSLSLLTTNSKPEERLLTTANATSAASALAARMAAQLMAEYPDLWPETIRALIVHSAEWTDAMRQIFLPSTRQPKKAEVVRLVRHCGFGVPDLERALWSVENSLTMICEDRLYPFEREGRKDPTLRDMHLHRLPWPLQELEALGETVVEMRVTLSYFIEPNPSERGFSARYRYESHGLRYDVKRPAESEADFRARINAKARDEEERTQTGGNDPRWMIGTQNRHKGSLHSDIWRGSAADLASRGVIGVYPALGWWKTIPRLERYDQSARYALVVSIRAPEVDVELYSAIANQIAAPVAIPH